MLDLDILDQDLSDFPDLQNPNLPQSFSFPTGHFEGRGSTDNMDAFSFDSFLGDTSQSQHRDNGYQMDITGPRSALSRRPSQINSLQTADNSASSGCPLARLGSWVPSFTPSNTPQGGSNSNSCPITPPFTPTKGMGAMGLSPKGGSPCPSMCPTLTQNQTQNPQASSSSHTGATVAVQGTDFDWADLQPQTQSSAALIGGGTQGGGGFSTPGKTIRTTITLEDAEPGMIMDVMKVLVSSNARVRFETD